MSQGHLTARDLNSGWLLPELMLAIALTSAAAWFAVPALSTAYDNYIREQMSGKMAAVLHASRALAISSGCQHTCTSNHNGPCATTEFPVALLQVVRCEGRGESLLLWRDENFRIVWKGLRRSIAPGFGADGAPLAGSGSYWLCRSDASAQIIARVVVNRSGRMRSGEYASSAPCPS